MRVIAGRAKGRQLKGPPGLATRPTSDKVRGAIFSMLESMLEASRDWETEGDEASPWEGCRVLDLYAGTGALGIEALSRGASEADFVELNPEACKVIRENLVRTKLAPYGRVHCGKVGQFLHQARTRVAKGEAQPFDIVLMDPPYAEPGLEAALEALGAPGPIREGGWLIVEHSRKRSLPPEIATLSLAKARRHGDTEISVYLRHPSQGAGGSTAR